MGAPRLTRRLALEEAQTLPDGAGGHMRSWQMMGRLWAEVRAGTGREHAADFATVSRVAYRITVRAAPDGSPARPRPEQRFREGGRVFRILAVSERDPDGRYLVCFAREEVAA